MGSKEEEKSRLIQRREQKEAIVRAEKAKLEEVLNFVQDIINHMEAIAPPGDVGRIRDFIAAEIDALEGVETEINTNFIEMMIEIDKGNNA